MNRVTVIIPCFNEEATIGSVVERTRLLSSQFEVDIIVVDDGSTDRTSEIVKALDGVIFLQHDFNRGKGAAIYNGLRKAQGEVVVLLDADLEYNPSDIPRLVGPILDGQYAIVYGSRFQGEIKGMRFSHYVGNKILTHLTRVTCGVKLTDVLTGLKAFRIDVIENLALESPRFEFEMEATIIALQKGYVIGEVPIHYSTRRHGKAKINWVDGVRCFILVCRLRFRHWIGTNWHRSKQSPAQTRFGAGAENSEGRSSTG